MTDRNKTGDHYQGGHQKALWQVSISGMGTRPSTINVLAGNKTAAKKHDDVTAELKRMGLERKSARIKVETTCKID